MAKKLESNFVRQKRLARREIKDADKIEQSLIYFWGMFHESHYPTKLVSDWLKRYKDYKPKTKVNWVGKKASHTKKNDHNRSLTIKEETARKVAALKKILKGKYNNKSSYRERRQEFNEIKKFYLPQGLKCWCCGVVASLRHHIIMVSRGGTNDPWNIVPLCKKCHSQLHSWL